MTAFAFNAFLAGGSYFIATVTYFYVDARLYLPIFFLVVALAVLPAEGAVSQVLKLRFSPSMVGVLTVFLLTCIGYPSQSGFQPQRNRSQVWDVTMTLTKNASILAPSSVSGPIGTTAR